MGLFSSAPFLRRACGPIVFLLIVALLVATNILYRNQSTALKVDGSKDTASCTADGNCIIAVDSIAPGQTTGTGIIATARFVSLDPVSRKFTFRYTLQYFVKGAQQPFNATMTVLAGEVTKKLDETSGLNPGFDVAITADSGDQNDYPFDVYAGFFLVVAGTGTSLTSTASIPIPIGFIVDSGSLGAYNAKSVIQDLSTGTNYGYAHLVEIRRSTTTKFFCILIGVIQWAVCLSYFALTMDFRYPERKIELPVVALGGALLFAMPALRNAAPNAPVIGTQFDLASFFYAEAVIAACMIFNILRFIWQYTPPKKPAADAPAKSDLPVVNPSFSGPTDRYYTTGGAGVERVPLMQYGPSR